MRAPCRRRRWASWPAYLAAPRAGDAALVVCCTVAERGKPPAALLKRSSPSASIRQVQLGAQGRRAVGPRPGRRAGVGADAAGGPDAGGNARSVRRAARRGRPAAGGGVPRHRGSVRRRSTGSSGVSVSRRPGICATRRSARICRARSGPCARSRRAATRRSWCWEASPPAPRSDQVRSVSDRMPLVAGGEAGRAPIRVAGRAATGSRRGNFSLEELVEIHRR